MLKTGKNGKQMKMRVFNKIALFSFHRYIDINLDIKYRVKGII